jgi:hypothetical protein
MTNQTEIQIPSECQWFALCHERPDVLVQAGPIGDVWACREHGVFAVDGGVSKIIGTVDYA